MHPTQVQAQQLDPCFYADSGHIPAEYPRPPYPISPHEHFRHHQLHPPSSSNSPFDDGVRLREAPAPHARGASAAAAAVLSPLPPPPSASVRPSPGNYNADAASDQSAQHRPGDGKRRRERSRRYRLAKSQISCMTELFAVDPSPSGEVHAMVSNATGVPRKAVRLWFQNTRARLRRDAKAAGIVNLNTTADLRRFQRNQEQKQGNYSSKISDSATMVEISQQLCNILRMYKEGRYGPVDRRNAAAHHSSAASSAAQDRGVGSGKSDSVDDDEDQDEDESEYDGTK
ncbi:hypothetical protein HDU83_004525 [Entophlyctis luteolus]|nr:hypothetical protein HDU83_004525 [Entophlyctis luteolus]